MVYFPGFWHMGACPKRKEMPSAYRNNISFISSLRSPKRHERNEDFAKIFIKGDRHENQILIMKDSTPDR